MALKQTRAIGHERATWWDDDVRYTAQLSSGVRSATLLVTRESKNTWFGQSLFALDGHGHERIWSWEQGDLGTDHVPAAIFDWAWRNALMPR